MVRLFRQNCRYVCAQYFCRKKERVRERDRERKVGGRQWSHKKRRKVECERINRDTQKRWRMEEVE